MADIEIRKVLEVKKKHTLFKVKCSTIRHDTNELREELGAEIATKGVKMAGSKRRLEKLFKHQRQLNTMEKKLLELLDDIIPKLRGSDKKRMLEEFISNRALSRVVAEEKFLKSLEQIEGLLEIE